MPTPRAYYNEIDIKAAAWLRELIKAGHIAPGDVDERSIADVQPSELVGYTQCHFFAGIGGWSYALRLAGWPDNRPVWTGSCPCQPFSTAGKRGGTDDARHLWPEFYRLIGECRPATVFGEQVASKDGLAWLDIVCTDLERTNYAIGAADMCAAGVGAPHIRQRLYFVAESESQQRDWRRDSGRGRGEFADGSDLGDTTSARLFPSAQPGIYSGEESSRARHGKSQRPSAVGGVADTDGGDAGTEREQRGGQYGFVPQNSRVDWSAHRDIPCTDGKSRPGPIEPEFQPLAHGVSHRVGRLHGYGNAIVPQVAAEFIGAYLDIVG